MTIYLMISGSLFGLLVQKYLFDEVRFVVEVEKICRDCLYYSQTRKRSGSSIFDHVVVFYQRDDMEDLVLGLDPDPENDSIEYHAVAKVVDGDLKMLEDYLIDEFKIAAYDEIAKKQNGLL